MPKNLDISAGSEKSGIVELLHRICSSLSDTNAEANLILLISVRAVAWDSSATLAGMNLS